MKKTLYTIDLCRLGQAIPALLSGGGRYSFKARRGLLQEAAAYFVLVIRSCAGVKTYCSVCVKGVPLPKEAGNVMGTFIQAMARMPIVVPTFQKTGEKALEYKKAVGILLRGGDLPLDKKQEVALFFQNLNALWT
jgi:hypothetical protein